MAAQAWIAILEHEVGKMQSNKTEGAKSCGRQSKNTETLSPGDHQAALSALDYLPPYC